MSVAESVKTVRRSREKGGSELKEEGKKREKITWRPLPSALTTTYELADCVCLRLCHSVRVIPLNYANHRFSSRSAASCSVTSFFSLPSRSCPNSNSLLLFSSEDSYCCRCAFCLCPVFSPGRHHHHHHHRCRFNLQQRCARKRFLSDSPAVVECLSVAQCMFIDLSHIQGRGRERGTSCLL